MSSKKKYYEAYEERYKQVHALGLSWSVDTNTPIIDDIINRYDLKKSVMLEIGCGEGRDARFLLNKGYNLFATDISKEAIIYCQKNDYKHKNKYKVLDVLNGNLYEVYDFIYSIACLHMLVLDDDRNKFYRFIYNHLTDNGYALILSMGNGKIESQSNISEAFNRVKRTHQETNQELTISQTSCRIVNFETMLFEVTNAKFEVVEKGITSIENHFDSIMYILIKKKH